MLPERCPGRMSRASPGAASRTKSAPATDDPLGELERELLAAARRRSRASGVPPRSGEAVLSGVLAVAFAGFALALVVGVLVLLGTG
jgi:hypothetical protein